MTESPLLAHLSHSFIRPLEDRATDALAFILRRSGGCRCRFESFIANGHFASKPIVKFHTQFAIDAQSRPDMIGCDDAGKRRLLVESKFWAPLQPQQAPRYLDALDPDGPSVLLFICPANRLNYLWREVEKQMAECGISLDLQSEFPADATYRATLKNSEKRVLMVSWNHLLDQLDSGKEGFSVRSDIHQLRGFAADQNDKGFVPLPPDAGAGIYRDRDAHLRTAVYEVVGRGRNAGWLNTDGLRTVETHDWYGRYALVVGTSMVLRLSIDYRPELFGCTPIWVSISQGYLSENARFPDRFEGPKEDRFWLPLYLKSCTVFEELLDDIEAQLFAVAKEVQEHDSV